MNLRYRSSADTLSLLSEYIKQAGVSRLADLSYLDDATELYVFSAIRPNAKSITTSMGKSSNAIDARCAALMESIETYFAEEVQADIKNVSLEDLIRNQELFVDIKTLGYGSTLSNNQTIDWCLGNTLLSKQKIYIPHIALSLDSHSALSKMFGANSDGIASGSNAKEALVFSFFEVVERLSTKSSTRKQLYQIDDMLLSSMNPGKINYQFYLYENDYKLPVIECNIINSNPLDNQAIFAGYCGHFSKHEALIKAFNEAVQSKIGVISGARDDLGSSCYNYSKINSLASTVEKQDFEMLTSLSLSLDQQYDQIISLLHARKQDLAIYTYFDEDITVLKSFIINNE